MESSTDNGEVKTLKEDMPLVKIQEECMQDTLDWFPDMRFDMEFYTVALAGEAGEYADIVKKMMRGDAGYEQPMTPELHREVAFELVDILIYLSLCANVLNVDLAKTYQIKREMNVGRFGRETGAVEQ